MSETYPTLSKYPVSIEKSRSFDPSIRSNPEDGKVISRRRTTAIKNKFEIEYDNLTAADKMLLESLEDTVGIGADTILWTNTDPNDSTVYTVRLSPEGIVFNIKPENYNKWTAKLTFIEA